MQHARTKPETHRTSPDLSREDIYTCVHHSQQYKLPSLPPYVYQRECHFLKENQTHGSNRTDGLSALCNCRKKKVGVSTAYGSGDIRCSAPLPLFGSSVSLFHSGIPRLAVLNSFDIRDLPFPCLCERIDCAVVQKPMRDGA